MPREYDPALEPKQEFYRIKTRQTGAAGDLIRHEVVESRFTAALTAARVTYRVLYWSKSGLGDEDAIPTDAPIAVSGLVAFPKGAMPAEGWPVLSWAHGTVGSNDESAPSMDPYLEQAGVGFGDKGKPLLRNINRAPHALLNAFLEAGWAVVMTDYEGLGTYGNHPYLLGVSQGRGILDIVPAARQLAEALELKLAERYAIVGHSQGGQAALWAAHLASTGKYASPGTLLGVAALAPASNLQDGLPAMYVMTTIALTGDIGGFFVLFCNGVFGGDASIDKDLIFQEAAVTQYDRDFNTLSRAELSEEDFWTDRPPLAPDPADRSAGIFRTQRDENLKLKEVWRKYWAQVAAFNPALEITVPIRISQAEGDKRVQPVNTRKLLGQLKDLGVTGVEDEFYGSGVPVPVPPVLGEHFGLLADPREIEAVVAWVAKIPAITR